MFSARSTPSPTGRAQAPASSPTAGSPRPEPLRDQRDGGLEVAGLDPAALVRQAGVGDARQRHLVAGRSRARWVLPDLVRELADPARGAHEGEHGVGRLRLRSQVDRLDLALKRVHLEGEAALCTHGIGFVRIVSDADRAWSGPIPYSSPEIAASPDRDTCGKQRCRYPGRRQVIPARAIRVMRRRRGRTTLGR